MIPPVENLSQLSPQSMLTSTELQDQWRDGDSAEVAYESDIESSIVYDEAAGIATFPTGTRYSVHDLDIETRDAVVKSLSTPSKLELRGFSPRGQEYIFLVSETIDYHVRTSYGGGPYDGPSCSCRQDERSAGLQHPCRHTLWVCDQILSQLVPIPEDPHTWGIDGYTTEHGNVCDYISDFHFDVLADSLQCNVILGDAQPPRLHRIRTAREIMATLSGCPVEEYRPDLTGEMVGRRVVKEGDLEETVFRMLLENDSLCSYFLKSMRNHEPLNPRFRRFRNRADAALDAFDKYVKSSDTERAALSKNPQWCYMTFTDISEQLRSIIMYSERELDDHDCRAAANTLIYILEQVVTRNEDHEEVSRTNDSGSLRFNLCNELIVESSDNFILDVLDKIQLEFVGDVLSSLDRIERVVTANQNIPQSFLDKLREIVSRLRRANWGCVHDFTVNSKKRGIEDDNPYPKRVK